MPRYYFDISDNYSLTLDHFGVDLDNFEEARDQAIAILPDLAREELLNGERHAFTCQIRDSDGRVIYCGSLTFHGEKFAAADQVAIAL